MSVYNTRLLTPPREEEDIPLYRPVWRALIVEVGLFAGLMVALFVAVGFLGVRFPAGSVPVVNVGIVLFPLVMWALVSYRAERKAPAPRTRLLAALIVSALASNAVVMPVLHDVLEIEQWLYIGGTPDRVISHMFTLGIAQMALVYLIMRYLIYQDHIRVREDGIAYSAAIALGYVIVSGIREITGGNPAPDVLAARLFSEYSTLIVAGSVLSYGLVELRYDRASWILLPFTASLGALLVGISIATRTNLLSGGFTIAGVTAPRPLFGIGFSIAVFAGVLAALIFFYDNANRKDAERKTDD